MIVLLLWLQLRVEVLMKVRWLHGKPFLWVLVATSRLRVDRALKTASCLLNQRGTCRFRDIARDAPRHCRRRGQRL